ncbi:MAG: hypothetical protein ACXACY_19185 [Candidatus Hodarchaeales archaeon]|jgi:hypothetical protein
MKIFKIEKVQHIVRISFNAHTSITFEETTIEEVYEIFLKVFKDVETTGALLRHKVLQKPMTEKKTLITVRQEGVINIATKYKGVSKSKTLYGIAEAEAKKIFMDNYENFI